MILATTNPGMVAPRTRFEELNKKECGLQESIEDEDVEKLTAVSFLLSQARCRHGLLEISEGAIGVFFTSSFSFSKSSSGS